ncbi:MAG TPA: diguanylate cyclase [Pyrinomonadaceae bacterium]|jgi:diguanylate cyclase (GGDEF)-like protein
MKRIEPINDSPENQLEIIADESGLAVIVVDEKSSVLKANNNSICELLYASEGFAPRCAGDCGRAFRMAVEAGKAVSYECYAGLDCLAVPLKTEKPLVAIVGRAFTKAENYRKATERAIAGDWNKFPPTRFFENVLINGSVNNLEAAAKRIAALGEDVAKIIGGANPSDAGGVREPQVGSAPKAQDRAPETAKAAEQQEKAGSEITRRIAEFHRQSAGAARKPLEDSEDITAWRSLFGSLFNLSYAEACRSIVGFLSRRYEIASLAWLERRDDRFVSILATGALEGQAFRVNLPANDKLLFEALENERSLELRERGRGGERANPKTVALFPVAVGGEVQSALVVGDELKEELKRRIAKFCKTVAAQLEILRLREEVRRRNWLAEALEKFNESLKNLDAEDFWSHLTRVSAELMRAERSSLLVFDEKSDSLTVKAAIGATADRITNKTEKIGDRVARVVLNNGRPVVVRDIGKVGLSPAPKDWKYKTNSFISYPFKIGSRRVGVLNVADKADGGPYGESDLELLNAIAPQVAVLIDRATLKSRAGEYEQLSVTDGLTGLLNRRYLEERLAEEIKRSNRYGYPMCFMMIDVDQFKSYNDAFGHTEGDKALKLVAQCFRETLRGADVAARYGGEEFSILLPQTTTAEAETIAERLRAHVEAMTFPNRAITVSIGIASCSLELNSAQDLIVAADSALYSAKRKGRNTVHVYDDLKKSSGSKNLPEGRRE